MLRSLAAVLLLTVIYALTLASADPADLLLGALVATGLVVLFRHARARDVTPGASPPAWSSRALAVAPFAGAIIGDIVAGTWAVALVTLHLRPLDRPGIVAVPLGARTPRGVAVAAFATTLSPGSYLLEVDWTRRVMLLHVLDARDPAAVAAAHQRFYDRYQRHVFP